MRRLSSSEPRCLRLMAFTMDMPSDASLWPGLISLHVHKQVCLDNLHE